MSFSKLKKIHVIIIGSFLCVVAGVAMFFLMIKPQQEALAAEKTRYENAAVKGNAQAEQRAIQDLQKARVEVALAEQALQARMAEYMPDLSFYNRETGMLALWDEQIKTLGPLLENFARDKNVQVMPVQFQIPAPPTNPNSSVFENDLLEFELGPITAVGDFKSLMNHLRRWNRCSRLVMVTNPQLSGISPNLTLTYNIRCFIFPKTKASPESKIPIAGGGATEGT